MGRFVQCLETLVLTLEFVGQLTEAVASIAFDVGDKRADPSEFTGHCRQFLIDQRLPSVELGVAASPFRFEYRAVRVEHLRDRGRASTPTHHAGRECGRDERDDDSRRHAAPPRTSRRWQPPGFAGRVERCSRCLPREGCCSVALPCGGSGSSTNGATAGRSQAQIAAESGISVKRPGEPSDELGRNEYVRPSASARS
jgi:hypothetical protein